MLWLFLKPHWNMKKYLFMKVAIHKFFKHFWKIFENADWSVIILRVLWNFFKNWGNISQFGNRWNSSFNDWSIKQEMKNFWKNIIIFFDNFCGYICSEYQKKNKSFELETFLITFMLGLFLYLTKAFRIGSEIFPEMSSYSWYSGTLRLITMLEKKAFIILAVSLSLLIILSFSINVILSVDKTFSEKNGVTVFQDLLLSMIFFSLSLR